MKRRHSGDAIAVGGALAVFAAVAFGLTTPLIKRFGSGIGPFMTASLLYGGAAISSLFARAPGETPLRVRNIPRLLGVAAMGALVAPVCLAWGLQRTGATGASLLLNCEALFTVLLARALFAEPIGRRVAVAVGLMIAASTLLVVGDGQIAFRIGLGQAAVLAASLAWALDNTLTRPLADFDPTVVVLGKAAIGAALSLGLAFALHERAPDARDAFALGMCGAVGYGMSLRLYLLAQRRIGAARTGSIFSIAPFLGAAVAWALGDRSAGWTTAGAGALFSVAVYLHLTEAHGHIHDHEAIEHEHAHGHDDEHHDHFHERYPTGPHTHWHRHEPRTHRHPHAPDLHHRHRHE